MCDAGPTSITRLTESFDMTRQAITKHLRVMEAAGLVHRTQRGRKSLWLIEPKRLAATRRHLESISAQWDDALHRLKRLVEE